MALVRRITVRLTDDEYEAANLCAQAQGRATSNWARQLVRDELARQLAAAKQRKREAQESE